MQFSVFFMWASMDFLTLPIFIQLIGMLCAGFGFWYKTTTDAANSTQTKVTELRKATDEEIGKLRSEIASMRASSISRTEHDQDIENVKQEIRAFRDEVRDDIRSLNTTLTSRFDLMMQKIIEFRFSQKE